MLKKSELIRELNERMKNKGLKERKDNTFYKAMSGALNPSMKFAQDLESVTEIPFHHFMAPDKAPVNPWDKLLKELEI